MKIDDNEIKIFSKNFCKISLITILSVITNIIVIITGGTSGSWPQLNIVIIIISAYFWSLKGSLIVALVLGLIAGPFMPLDVSQGIMQEPSNWIFRLLVYLFIGFVVGYFKYLNERMHEKEKENAQISSYTGLYNTNELFKEINRIINNKEKCRLIFINIVNLEDISKYVSYTLITKAIKDLADYLKGCFEDNTIYSSNFNQYWVLVKGDFNNEEIQKKLKDIEEMSNLGVDDDYNLRLFTKVGITDIDSFNVFDAAEIFNRARIAADQGSSCEAGIYYYNDFVAEKNKMFVEVSTSLKDAISNDEFYLVYQPIIDINENKVSGAEVLVRWDRGKKEKIGPNTFVDIAEKTGQINDLSKLIFRKNIKQILEWQKKSLDIKTSINLTATELVDDNFRIWIKNIMDRNHINRKGMGIEITERKLTESKKIKGVLSDLIDLGYNVLLDDFGTGYNSLMTFGEIPFDIVKIDKYFIDRIFQREIKILIKNIIESVHQIGRKVVAEGVETKEQYELLKNLGCDKIQGYYFSKPLLANEFEEFYIKFNTY